VNNGQSVPLDVGEFGFYIGLQRKNNSLRMQIRLLLQSGIKFFRVLGQTGLGAIAFYTTIPIPHHWALNFSGIARWAPAIGLLIGGGLGLVDTGLALLHLPILVRSAMIVGMWVLLTGGLHLDGAIDTADGLAVLDPDRRLDVMADSRTGAFGVMAAGLILLLKTSALASLDHDRGFVLMLAAGWGRWGQLVAIAHYPYLKPQGKGAFHKAAIRSAWEPLPCLGLLLAVNSLPLWAGWQQGGAVALAIGGGIGLLTAVATAAWLHHKLGGHTGDTYGAIVEWTEVAVLCGSSFH